MNPDGVHFISGLHFILLNMHILFNALFIFTLRLCDVSLGTMRTMFTVQGKKYLAAGIGLFEVTIWIVAIRQVFSQLDNPWNIIGYAAGFATGTFLGITLEEKIALGHLHIYIVSRHNADDIADALRVAKFGVTMIPGEGGSGGMAIIMTNIKRNRIRELHDIVDAIDPNAFISKQSTVVSGGFIHNMRK